MFNGNAQDNEGKGHLQGDRLRGLALFYLGHEHLCKQLGDCSAEELLVKGRKEIEGVFLEPGTTNVLGTQQRMTVAELEACLLFSPPANMEPTVRQLAGRPNCRPNTNMPLI